MSSNNACGLDENTIRFLKSRNVDCDKFSFEAPGGTQFDSKQCLNNDYLLSLIPKSTRCTDKNRIANYLFDERSEAHLLQTEKSVEAYKLKDIKTYIIEQLKEHFLKEYETYVIRGMYSHSASLKEKEEAKTYLFGLFKFYFAFDTKPYVNQKRNHIIFPKGYSHDFEFVQNEDKIVDLYVVSKTIMNMYEDVCDGMSARELRDLENCIDKSITDNSRKNMEDLQEKILNLLGTDPNFNIKMLNAQCDN